MNFEKLLNNNTIKKILVSLIIGICITSYVTEYSNRVMADISSSVVRLHVVANSDRDDDQHLKLKVRDDVIEYLKPILDKAENTEETKKLISQNIKGIKNKAEKTVKENGYTYSIAVNLNKFEFPEKRYEDTVFPSGEYDALRITIGEANGKNWWCVLYPQLCFVESNSGKLPDESRQKLKNVLTDDEYEMITSDKVNFKLKIVELFSN